MMTILVNVAHMSFKTPGCNEGKKRKWQDYEISLSFFAVLLALHEMGNITNHEPQVYNRNQ